MSNRVQVDYFDRKNHSDKHVVYDSEEEAFKAIGEAVMPALAIYKDKAGAVYDYNPFTLDYFKQVLGSVK